MQTLMKNLTRARGSGLCHGMGPDGFRRSSRTVVVQAESHVVSCGCARLQVPCWAGSCRGRGRSRSQRGAPFQCQLSFAAFRDWCTQNSNTRRNMKPAYRPDRTPPCRQVIYCGRLEQTPNLNTSVRRPRGNNSKQDFAREQALHGAGVAICTSWRDFTC